jgi:hypothetical protein
MGVLIAACSSRAHRVFIVFLDPLFSRRSDLLAVDTAVGTAVDIDVSDCRCPGGTGAPPAAGRSAGDPDPHRTEVSRTRQAQSPYEHPLALGQSETFGPGVQISTPARQSARWIGRHDAVHPDHPEQSILRITSPATHTCSDADAARTRFLRQASHAPWYSTDHVPDYAGVLKRVPAALG